MILPSLFLKAGDHEELHSFPTRRSSDLRAELKLEARNRLRHNWGWAVSIGIVMTLFVGFFFARPAVSGSLKTANNVNDVMGTGSIDSLFKPAFWAGQIGPDTGLTFIGSFFMLSMVITFLHFARGERLSFFKGIFSDRKSVV